MLSHCLNVFLEGAHLLLITQNTYDIVSGNNPQFRKQCPYHLQVVIAGSVKQHRVDVLKYDMFLYQFFFQFYYCCFINLVQNYIKSV